MLSMMYIHFARCQSHSSWIHAIEWPVPLLQPVFSSCTSEYSLNEHNVAIFSLANSTFEINAGFDAIYTQPVHADFIMLIIRLAQLCSFAFEPSCSRRIATALLGYFHTSRKHCSVWFFRLKIQSSLIDWFFCAWARYAVCFIFVHF